MKALKEKRINLRSLWRRSLVILSLLALAFTACGGSDDADDRPNPVVELRVTGTPNGPSYQGLAPRLDGVTVTARYRDGSTRVVPLRETLIGPEFIYGTVPGAGTGDWTWVPNRNVTVMYGGVTANYTIPASVRVYAIVRTSLTVTGDTTIFNDAFFTNQTFFSGGAFHIHGAGQMQQNYYVDERPNFDRLVAEIYYNDGEQPMRLNLARDIPAAALQGVIHPHYDATPTTSGTGTFFVTFARHPNYDPGRAPNSQIADSAPGEIITGINEETGAFERLVRTQHACPGVTTALRLRNVHHVTNFEFVSPPAIAGVWYWDPNTTVAWRNRAVTADTTFRITYSNGTTRVATLRDLEQRPEVWRNDNDIANLTGNLGTTPARAESRPFTITEIYNPWYDADPTIEFYYRGWRIAHPVTVYQILNRIDVTEWETERVINFRNIGRWDNDRWIPGTEVVGTAQQFADLLTVAAIWTTRRSPVQEGRLVLNYRHALAQEYRANDGNPDPGPFVSISTLDNWWNNFSANPTGVQRPLAEMGRIYTMNFGVTSATDAVPAQGWGLVMGGTPALNEDTSVRVDIFYYSPRSAWELQRAAYEGRTAEDDRDYVGIVSNWAHGGALTPRSSVVRFLNIP
jgi:hypothetical protein